MEDVSKGEWKEKGYYGKGLSMFDEGISRPVRGLY
jgi:hypothetical protein